MDAGLVIMVWGVGTPTVAGAACLVVAAWRTRQREAAARVASSEARLAGRRHENVSLMALSDEAALARA